MSVVYLGKSRLVGKFGTTIMRPDGAIAGWWGHTPRQLEAGHTEFILESGQIVELPMTDQGPVGWSYNPYEVHEENFQLVARLHNRFTVLVHGNQQGIDVLKNLLVPNRDVKGITIYKGEGQGPHLEKLDQLNYTELTELRPKR